jgi:hypothetical protein
MLDKNAKGLPPGMRDPACRFVYNKVMQDQGIFEKYGAETNSEYTRSRVIVKPGGGVPTTLSHRIHRDVLASQRHSGYCARQQDSTSEARGHQNGTAQYRALVLQR